ncbi:MAG: hypothetical protein WA206_15370 [Candidatus Binatus sp.]
MAKAAAGAQPIMAIVKYQRFINAYKIFAAPVIAAAHAAARLPI